MFSFTGGREAEQGVHARDGGDSGDSGDGR